MVAGRPLIISVRFGGNPTPTLQWSHNNVVLGDSENFSCQYVGSDRAILTIARAERKHSGIHTVIAQNEAGDRTDTIRVTILGSFESLLVFITH